MAIASLATCGGEQADLKRSDNIHVIVTASDLAAAFEQSEARASELYVGKLARLTGSFSKTEPLADGHIAMTFKISRETFRPVRCIFDATASTGLNKLSAGDYVAVTGKIAGFAESRYFVTVDECLIEKEEQ